MKASLTPEILKLLERLQGADGDALLYANTVETVSKWLVLYGGQMDVKNDDLLAFASLLLHIAGDFRILANVDAREP